MDEEQHSSQGNKWWWLVYLGPMQGAYATRATAVANIPSASKIENTIEYFDTLTDLNCGWKKSCFHWHSHCPVHFACASVCHHPKPTPAVQTNEQTTASARNSVCAAQRTATWVPNDSAGSISSVPHAQRIAPSTPHDTASSISRIPRAGPAARLSGGRGQGGGVSGGSSQTNLSAHIHSPLPQPQRYFATCVVPFYPHSTPSRPSPPLPLLLLIPHPAGPSPLWSQLDKGLALTQPPVGTHSSKPDHSVKTEPKPRIKTEPVPCVKQEVKLKLNLQHDVERLRSHSHAYLYNPDSDSDDSMGVDGPVVE
ncbi:hypothetical protein B0H13DRAFT_2321459 [Mycena leptocephala]|nr:hypothetical protein B0H13DRAFT_2321459 [Mycena leptocephala]